MVHQLMIKKENVNLIEEEKVSSSRTIEKTHLDGIKCEDEHLSMDDTSLKHSIPFQQEIINSKLDSLTSQINWSFNFIEGTFSPHDRVFLNILFSHFMNQKAQNL